VTEKTLFTKFRHYYWKWLYRPGRTITRFIAKDIRRDVEVVDVSQIETGMISARIRTWNVLYDSMGVSPKPPFGDNRKIEITKLWIWSGQPWGGPVPDSPDGPT
jgi:hypothetical protein